MVIVKDEALAASLAGVKWPAGVGPGTGGRA